MSLSEQNTIRILLVDDHKSFSEGLAMVINSRKPAMEVVAMASTREEALDAVVKYKPDLAILDMDLGASNTLDFLPDFLERTSAKVLILTGMLDPKVHEAAIVKGARGVLLKGESAKTILKAIERVNAGEIWASNTTLSRVLSQLSNGKQNNGPADPEQQKIAELTPREREIITTLLSFESSTNEEIADHLCISQSTLKNHLTTIFSKLEVKNRIQLMKYAINHKLAKPV